MCCNPWTSSPTSQLVYVFLDVRICFKRWGKAFRDPTTSKSPRLRLRTSSMRSSHGPTGRAIEAASGRSVWLSVRGCPEVRRAVRCAWSNRWRDLGYQHMVNTNSNTPFLVHGVGIVLHVRMSFPLFFLQEPFGNQSQQEKMIENTCPERNLEMHEEGNLCHF